MWISLFIVVSGLFIKIIHYLIYVKQWTLVRIIWTTYYEHITSRMVNVTSLTFDISMRYNYWEACAIN